MVYTSARSHGGKRKNAGAKKKYREATVIVATRCPKSKVRKLRSIIELELSKYEK